MSDAERAKVPRSLREIREGAIEVFAGAEAELARVAGRVLDSIGLKGEGDVPARIRDSVNELVERARQRREEVERRVDEGVREAAARVGRPISDELGTLRTRLEKLQQRVDQLTGRPGATPSATSAPGSDAAGSAPAPGADPQSGAKPSE